MSDDDFHGAILSRVHARSVPLSGHGVRICRRMCVFELYQVNVETEGEDSK